MEELAVERSIWIAAPRDRVWQAITEPEQIAQWLLPPALGATMERDVAKLSVRLGPMAAPVAVLEGIDPPRRVTIRGLPDRLLATTFTLEADEGGTRVTVNMAGFDSLPEAAARERLGASGSGWEKALANLKAYLEGAGLPFPEGLVAALFGYRRDAQERLAVERSIWIAAPRARVWQAITDPKQIQEWFSPGTPWRLSAPQVGGKLSVYNPETDAHSYVQIIEVFDPPHLLVTRYAPQPSEMPTPHVTTWALAEQDGGTRVTMTYSGYELESAETRHNSMEQTAFGFGMMMDNLKAQIESQALPYPGGF